MFQHLTIQCLLKSCFNSSNPSSGTLQMKEKDLWIRTKASLLLFCMGTTLSGTVQPWMKELKACIPWYGVGRARSSCHRAARPQLHLCKPSPSQLKLPASTPISTASKQRLGELASHPLKTRKITLLFLPGIVTHSQWEETHSKAKIKQ